MQSAVYIRGMKKLALAAYSHSPRAEIVYARGAADKYDKGVRQSEGVYIYIYIYIYTCARARVWYIIGGVRKTEATVGVAAECLLMLYKY